jgi:hypothetical protein
MTMKKKAGSKPKLKRGFALMSAKRLKEVSRMGVEALPKWQRYFARNRRGARLAGGARFKKMMGDNSIVILPNKTETSGGYLTYLLWRAASKNKD